MEISPLPFLDPDDFFLSVTDFDASNVNKKRRITDINYRPDETLNHDDTSLIFDDLLHNLLSIENYTDPQVTTRFEPSADPIFETAGGINTPSASPDGSNKRLRNPDESSSPSNGSNNSQRRLWVKSRSKAWWEQCDSKDFPDEEFKKAFRMSKATFDMICKELEPIVNKKDTMLRLAIPVRQRVAVCVWRLATGEPLREVSKRFGLGISTCHKLVLEVCRAIQEVLKPKYLNWPGGERLARIQKEFQMVSGIPRVCGVLYTTHVPIIAPKEKAAAYYNKRHTERNQKTSYSISVQTLVDSSMSFTDVSIGWPGSMSDEKVLEKSSLSQRANVGLMKDMTLVGNLGHPLMDWLLTPYLHPNLNWTQHAYNEKVSEVQRFAKEACRRLKARWRCLQKRTEMKLQDLPVVLMACCVLHNICEMNNDELSPEMSFELFDDEMVAENGVRSVNALKYRDQIAHKLLHYNSAGTNFPL